MIHSDYLSILADAVEEGRMDAAIDIIVQIRQLFGEVTIGHENPWNRSSWHGIFISTDDCDATGFEPDENNILYVIAYGDTGPDWDGTAAGIVLLKDGRFVSWESTWGPTGSGFHEDAYGGNANIAFSKTLTMATRYISEQSRDILKYVPPKRTLEVLDENY